MKKILLLIALCSCGWVAPLCAEETLEWGWSGECLWDWGGARERYWFCGKQSSASCRGNRFLSESESASWYYSRGEVGEDTFTHDSGKNFICCNGDHDKEDTGRWIDYTGSDYWQESEKKLSDGGTCIMIANPCYNAGYTHSEYILIDCNTPGEHVCLEGKSARRVFDGHTEKAQVCAAPCESGEAYESYVSDTCIACKETARQGADSYGTCVTCRSDELFMASKEYGTGDNKRPCAGDECCIRKSDSSEISIISQEALARCWRCPLDRDVWRACVKQDESSDYESKCGLAK